MKNKIIIFNIDIFNAEVLVCVGVSRKYLDKWINKKTITKDAKKAVKGIPDFCFKNHCCYCVEINGKTYQINKRYFNVRLAPGSGAEVVIHYRHFANKPTLAFPWHGDMVPNLH